MNNDILFWGGIFIILLLIVIFQRIQEKSNEDFEDRDN